MCPLKVALADGRRLMSTHMCDIIILDLPTTLVGHIVPELSIASLFGISVLTAVGCTIKFDIKKCVVKYNDFFFNGHEGPDDRSMDPLYRRICRQHLLERYP